jgi:hypothetical protein
VLQPAAMKSDATTPNTFRRIIIILPPLGRVPPTIEDATLSPFTGAQSAI